MRYVFVILALTFLQSCDTFSTRTPEDPDTNSQVFEPATTPEVLIANFQLSIHRQQANGFAQCFSSEAPFLFTAASDASSVFGDVFLAWMAADEITWFERWLSETQVGVSPQLQFETDAITIGGTQSAVVETEYVFHTGMAESSEVQTVAGSMYLTLSSGTDGLWYISEWRDEVISSTQATWSMLKGNLVN